MLVAERTFDLDDILKNQRLLAHFQPIVSIKKQEIIGFEGLCRGYNLNSGSIIPPVHLFEAATDTDRIAELDLSCRYKVLSTFSQLCSSDHEYLLFLNADVSCLNEHTCEDESILRQIDHFNMDPSNIVIEIVESKAKNINILTKFVKFYKYYRFIIAVDDVGTGHSNLDRIATIEPDIIKTDRSLIQNIDTNFYKQEVFKSLVGLSRNIGSLMLAEGIETEEQAIRSVQLGASLLQGFYFAKPGAELIDPRGELQENLLTLSKRYGREESSRLTALREKNNQYKRAAAAIVESLSTMKVSGFDSCLGIAIQQFQFIDALYVLDLQGTQLTRTTLSGYHSAQRGSLFKPAAAGDSHSLKDYYYFLVSTGSDTFTTDAYISLATGNLCRTLSVLFKLADKSRFILCMDVIE